MSGRPQRNRKPTNTFNPAPQGTKRTRNNTTPPPPKKQKNVKGRALKPVAAAVKPSAVYNTPSKKWCAAAFEKYVGLLPEGARSNIEKRKEEFVRLFKRGSILQIDNLKNNNSQFKKEINLSDIQLLDFLVHMWLDGIHDSYINYNFRSFLSKNIKKKLNQIVYIFSDKSIQPTIIRIDDLAKRGNIGPYFTKIFNILDPSVVDKIKQNISADPSEKLTTFGTSWERTFKVALIKKYDIKTTTGGIFNIKSPSNNNIYLSIDQEFKAQGERSLTKLVNMLNKTRKSHVSYNIETIGTLLDPGSTMLQYGTQNILSFMRFNKTATDVDMFTTKFYFAPFQFIIKDRNGVNVSDVQCTLSPYKGDLVVSSNGHELELPVSKGAAAKANRIAQLEKSLEAAKNTGNKLLTPKQEKALEKKIQKIQTELNTATVNRKAGLNTSGVIEYSKYMGDALQYMILAASNPIRGITRGGPTVSSYGYTYFCSGDSMALIGYDLMCELCNNKEPRFIIDIAGAYSVEIAVSPQFEKDGFVIDFSKKVGGNMTVLTGETDGKMETDESSSVKYIKLIKKIAGENKTLIKNINPIFRQLLFGTINNTQLNMNLSKFTNTQLNSLTNLANINKLAGFKSKFDEFKQSASAAAEVTMARQAKRTPQRALAAALKGNRPPPGEGSGNSGNMNARNRNAAQKAAQNARNRNAAAKAAQNAANSNVPMGGNSSQNSQETLPQTSGSLEYEKELRETNRMMKENAQSRPFLS